MLGHQAKANAQQAEDLDDLVASAHAKVQAAAAARSTATPSGSAIDLDALVANQAKEPLPNWAALLHPEMTTWRETKPAADKNAAAVKKIKALLPDDVSPCTFAGVELRRDKRGLGIKEKK